MLKVDAEGHDLDVLRGALETIERGRRSDQMRSLSNFYHLYEARILDYKENPPPEDWNGAYQLLTK